MDLGRRSFPTAVGWLSLAQRSHECSRVPGAAQREAISVFYARLRRAMAQRCAAGTDLGFTRDRRSYAQVGQARLAWIVTICGGPGSAMQALRCARAASHPGRTTASDAFVALFTFQTAHLVPAAHVCTRGLPLCFTHPESRGGRSAEKRSGAAAPVGRIMTRYARRLARRLASHDAGRSPLGAPPWWFWASGPRFRLLRRPPSYNGGQLPSASCSELLAARS